VIRATLFFGLLLTLPLRSADPPPEFTAQGVGGTTIEPGLGLSIYGSHLGPAAGCVGSADRQHRETPNPHNPRPGFADTSIYPAELCETQVFIGDKPAGLLYVSERQINFKIPQDSAEDGTVDVRVIYKGQSSVSVTMKAGFPHTTVSLDQPAYTGMPVWLKVQSVFGSIQYPQVLGAAGFGCNEVQVRRDGKMLPLLPGSDWMKYGISFAGFICGAYAPGGRRDRLPLHLLYRFEQPGTYEVRFAQLDRPPGVIRPVTEQTHSEWTPIEVSPSQASQRSEWLEALRRRAPADPGELLTDVLPGLLGIPDDASLEILTGYLYHRDASVRRYAMNGLSYWPEESTSQRLLALLHTRGPSDELIVFLLRQPAFRAAHATEILKTSIPFLQSGSPVLMGGAIEAMRQLPDGISAVLEAALRSADHVLQKGNAQNAIDLLQAMSATKDERVHALVRNFVERGHDVGLIMLASFRSARDLPLLGSLLADAADPNLPGLLYESYGKAAIPYLESALKASPDRFTARNIAGALMAAGDPVGYQFAQRAMLQPGQPRTDIMEILKSQNPELRLADDGAMAAFVNERAGR
jgi:hypothetical protein